MKKFNVYWETDYCDDFPDKQGTAIIEAETPEEAAKKFKAMNTVHKALVTEVTERNV